MSRNAVLNGISGSGRSLSRLNYIIPYNECKYSNALQIYYNPERTDGKMRFLETKLDEELAKVQPDLAYEGGIPEDQDELDYITITLKGVRLA